MKLITLLFLTIGFAQSSLAERVETTNNPVQYAEKSSLYYAEGDTGDTRGWEGCDVKQLYPQRVHILCEGTMTVLVHGGHESQKRFVCEYLFERRSTNLFYVKHQLCN
jgi:hypothetical protein